MVAKVIYTFRKSLPVGGFLTPVWIKLASLNYFYLFALIKLWLINSHLVDAGSTYVMIINILNNINFNKIQILKNRGAILLNDLTYSYLCYIPFQLLCYYL